MRRQREGGFEEMSRRKGSENIVQCVPEDTRDLLEPFKSHLWGWVIGNDFDSCLRCGTKRKHKGVLKK